MNYCLGPGGCGKWLEVNCSLHCTGCSVKWMAAFILRHQSDNDDPRMRVEWRFTQ